MRKDWKYILYLSLGFGLFVVVKLLAPKQYNWSVTYSHVDKNPYGAYALNELLPAIFPEEGIYHSYETLYEIKDSLKRSGNILIICSNFNAGKEDTEALLKHVEKGGTAFISAQYFSGRFADTLQLSTNDYVFETGDVFGKKDTTTIHFVNSSLDTTRKYYYKRNNIHNYFNKFDTTRTTAIAQDENGRLVSIRMQWGKGALILNTTPLVFTNIYILAQQNHEFVSTTLSYLPKADVEWTEYYHLGRREIATPLRFVLTNEPLRWAYYITVAAILLFMVFEMKRKQRIIPIIKPLANTTLEFVSTIGNLYYQNKEHKNIAEKKIIFFMEHIRSRYWLTTIKLDEAFVQTLSRKSGKTEKEILTLLKFIELIQSKQQISAHELIELNKKIEEFNR